MCKKKKKMGFLLKLWRFMLFDPMPVSLGFAVNQKEKKVVSEDKCPGWEKKQKKTRLLSYTQTRTYIFPVGFIFLMTDHRERRQSSSPPRSNREILSSVSACPGGFLTRPFLPSSSRRRRRKHTAHLIFQGGVPFFLKELKEENNKGGNQILKISFLFDCFLKLENDAEAKEPRSQAATGFSITGHDQKSCLQFRRWTKESATTSFVVFFSFIQK